MNVAVIGSGGREHALCFKLSLSKKISKLFCIPGNPGTSLVSKNIEINYLDFSLLYTTLLENNISIVIIGPEIPLVEGIVDFLSSKKIFAFGPSKKASQLEGSKAFMKKLCKDFNIPTAKYENFDDFLKAERIYKKIETSYCYKVRWISCRQGCCYFFQ